MLYQAIQAAEVRFHFIGLAGHRATAMTKGLDPRVAYMPSPWRVGSSSLDAVVKQSLCVYVCVSARWQLSIELRRCSCMCMSGCVGLACAQVATDIMDDRRSIPMPEKQKARPSASYSSSGRTRVGGLPARGLDGRSGVCRIFSVSTDRSVVA